MVTPKLSIVIPVYNVEEWLEECIESILKITAFSIQVVLVNDGSTDNSTEIATRYRDSNPEKIELINQANAGMAAARNAGLNVVSGEYISFIDSDDYIDAQALEKLVFEAEKSGAQIVLGRAQACFGEGFKDFRPINTELGSLDLSKVYSGLEFLSNMLEANANNVVVWDKVYKRSLIETAQVRFINGLIHEDVPFCFEALLACERLFITDINFYFYRQRGGSIMHTLDEKSAVSRYKLTKYLLNYTDDKRINNKALNDYFVYQLKRAKERIDFSDRACLLRLFKRKLSLKRRLILLTLMIR